MQIKQHQRDDMMFIKGLISAQGHFSCSEDSTGHHGLWEQISCQYEAMVNELLDSNDHRED